MFQARLIFLLQLNPANFDQGENLIKRQWRADGINPSKLLAGGRAVPCDGIGFCCQSSTERLAAVVPLPGEVDNFLQSLLPGFFRIDACLVFLVGLLLIIKLVFAEWTGTLLV